MTKTKFERLTVKENVEMNDLFCYEDMVFYEPNEEVKEKYFITVEFLDTGNPCRRTIGLKNVSKKLGKLVNTTKRYNGEKTVRILEKVDNFEIRVNEKYVMSATKEDVLSFFSGKR